MKAVVYRGIGNIVLEDVPEPEIQEPDDAIIRIAASAICETDLHLVRDTFPGVKEGRILGHEAVEIIEEVGISVRNLRKGDIDKVLEKNLTLKTGNYNHRRYLPETIELVRRGVIRPEQFLAKKEPMPSAIDAYRSFAEHERGWIKVKLKPASYKSKAA